MASKVFPTLYGTASGGKTKIYNIRVDEHPKSATITMTHGYEDGKQACSKRDITTGLNLGKSNETSIFEQAVSDAQSKWNKKIDKGYTVTKKAQSTRVSVLPMLAQTYSKIEKGKEKGRKKYMKFPCYVQPKLDGVRCLSNVEDADEIPTYLSRGGKEFDTLEHLNTEVEEIFPFDTLNVAHLDGEIYCHNEITFQDVVAAVKKKKNENTPKLKYYIYDIATLDMTFEERKTKLEQLFKGQKLEHLVLVPTYEVNSEAEIIKYHEQFVEDGYEGIIIRNKDGQYCFDHRSNDLQKWKNFIDKEFKIIGGKEATGEDSGTVVFILDNGDGQTFECRPRGSRELRREWFKNLESLKGRWLTVRYQNLSDSGIPRFPVGITIRDYE